MIITFFTRQSFLTLPEIELKSERIGDIRFYSLFFFLLLFIFLSSSSVIKRVASDDVSQIQARLRTEHDSVRMFEAGGWCSCVLRANDDRLGRRYLCSSIHADENG